MRRIMFNGITTRRIFIHPRHREINTPPLPIPMWQLGPIVRRTQMPNPIPKGYNNHEGTETEPAAG